MKPCANFFCKLHKSEYDTNCSFYNKTFESCHARKRYNRSIAPLLALWSVVRNAWIFQKSTVYTLVDKLNKERNKYPGRG
jgi:hypothetical protein